MVWKIVEATSVSGTDRGKDGLRVGITHCTVKGKNGSADSEVIRVAIRVSRKLLDLMNWSQGDRLRIYCGDGSDSGQVRLEKTPGKKRSNSWCLSGKGAGGLTLSATVPPEIRERIVPAALLESLEANSYHISIPSTDADGITWTVPALEKA